MKDSPQLPGVVGAFRFQHHIGAMEGNNARLGPAADEGQQMHAGVAKINVHEIGPAAFEQIGQELVFAPVNDRRLPLDKLEPAVPKWIWSPFSVML
jgi:hypothetical protein